VSTAVLKMSGGERATIGPPAFMRLVLVLLTVPRVLATFLNCEDIRRDPGSDGDAVGSFFESHMLGKLIDGFFGCWHRRYGFPITVRRGSRRNEATSLTGTYVVCLDCGKEFPYDWKEMRLISTHRQRRHYVRSLATKTV